MRNHLIPGLGSHKLKKLQPEHIQAWINRQKAYSPASIHWFYNVLHCALKQVVANKMIFHNLADPTTLPKIEAKSLECFSAEEANALLAALPDNTSGRAIRFILGTGLRVSELCKLRWCDVSEAGITINQITYTIKNQRIVDPPKTHAGIRFIPTNVKLRALLGDNGKHSSFSSVSLPVLHGVVMNQAMVSNTSLQQLLVNLQIVAILPGVYASITKLQVWKHIEYTSSAIHLLLWLWKMVLTLERWKRCLVTHIYPSHCSYMYTVIRQQNAKEWRLWPAWFNPCQKPSFGM